MRRLFSQSLLCEDDDFYYYRILQVCVRSIGTLRNYDAIGNVNVKKEIGLKSKTTIPPSGTKVVCSLKHDSPFVQLTKAENTITFFTFPFGWRFM